MSTSGHVTIGTGTDQTINIEWGRGKAAKKYSHDSSAMVCSLTLTNELSNRMGTKHRWHAKLTLTLLAFDIFDLLFESLYFNTSYRTDNGQTQNKKQRAYEKHTTRPY